MWWFAICQRIKVSYQEFVNRFYMIIDKTFVSINNVLILLIHSIIYDWMAVEIFFFTKTPMIFLISASFSYTYKTDLQISTIHSNSFFYYSQFQWKSCVFHFIFDMPRMGVENEIWKKSFNFSLILLFSYIFWAVLLPKWRKKQKEGMKRNPTPKNSRWIHNLFVCFSLILIQYLHIWMWSY